jgi:RimJ/RimL family protein N-acetyltransferase
LAFKQGVGVAFFCKHYWSNFMREFTSKSGKKILVREINQNDVDSLFDYITEIGKEDTFIEINPNSLVTYEEEGKYVSDCLEKIAKKEMLVLLAFFEDELIGSVSVEVQLRRKQHIGMLGIAIKKNFRGDGIGKKLMELAINEAKTKLSVTQITLGCYANNNAGLALYKKLGFSEYGRLPKGVFRQGAYVDEVLFRKEITPEKLQ